MRLIADVETDNHLDKLTKIHCLVLRDMDTGELVASCADQPGYPPIREGLRLLSEAERIYAHNGLGFDIPAIQKVYPGWTYTGRLMDTLIIARMRWAHIKDTDFALVRQGKLPGRLVGWHSLEAWGHRMGLHKGEYTTWCKDAGIENPWSDWRREMQEYCEQDTEVTRMLAQRIHAAGVSDESVETELKLHSYLLQQESNGWPFDVDAAIALQAKLAGLRQKAGDELREHFGWWYTPGKEFTPKRDNRTMGYVKGCPCTKLNIIEFNPASRDQIADRLTTLYGWKPTVFTKSGKPQLNDVVLDGLEFPKITALKRYLLLDKRLGQLSEGKQAWLKLMQENNPATGLTHIHHRVNGSGAVTHRASHKDPNLAQVPKVTNPFGKECRSLFMVPPGWVMVGVDVSGLELRSLAHYMALYDDGDYGRIILEADVHSANRDAMGLAGDEGRDIMKTWIYAYLYGAGDLKLGTILLPGASEAERMKAGKAGRRKFEKNLPALGAVSKAVREKATKFGWLRLIDGRRAYIRSAHAALNTLLQGTGAVICKRWIVHFNRTLTETYGPQGWRGQWAALGWVHDEVQLAVRPEIADDVGKILVRCIEDLTDHFSFRIPLTGAAKVGANWKETH